MKPKRNIYATKLEYSPLSAGSKNFVSATETIKVPKDSIKIEASEFTLTNLSKKSLFIHPLLDKINL
jgi:hypothetical protein